LDHALRFLDAGLDGVMIGRAAYHTPWEVLSDADARIFGDAEGQVTRLGVVDAMRPYIERHLSDGGKLHQITRHMLGLFAGQPGARAWRRVLSTDANKPLAGLEVLDRALDAMQSRAA
jgi:tRNA-dihydrouridine synthase A